MEGRPVASRRRHSSPCRRTRLSQTKICITTTTWDTEHEVQYPKKVSTKGRPLTSTSRSQRMLGRREGREASGTSKTSSASSTTLRTATTIRRPETLAATLIGTRTNRFPPRRARLLRCGTRRTVQTRRRTCRGGSMTPRHSSTNRRS